MTEQVIYVLEMFSSYKQKEIYYELLKIEAKNYDTLQTQS